LIENLTGSGFSDTLIGDGNINVLNGGGGADILKGGAGGDTLIGGEGADQFLFAATGNGVDVITDFSGQTAFGGGAGQGDRFTFDDVLQGAFGYRGSQAFTGSGNTEARVANGKVIVDADGNGAVDITITVTGLTSASQLGAGDFQFI
jgi:Ca2+-binding RTX toxin-like protein